jgi:hypothetical protein
VVFRVARVLDLERCFLRFLLIVSVSGLSGTALGVPLKQLGNPHLKAATKPNTLRLTMQDTAHAAEAPTAHQGSPLEDPLEQASPRSRARASLGRAPPRSRGCAYLEQAPPRSRVHSALKRDPPRSRALRTRACSRTRAFNTLTSAGRHHHAPGARAPVPPHQLPRREPIPTTVGGTVRRGWCQSRDAAPPAPVRLTRRALEGGPAAPSIYLSCDPAGLGGGARPVGRHPCHC